MSEQTQIAYATAYERVQAALMKLDEAIHDLPAPDGETAIDWSHVGSMNHIAAMIDEAAQ
jgi:hypothetical protein